MIQLKGLETTLKLDQSVKIYVPSNIQGKVVNNSAIADHIRLILSSLFGGATSFPAIGSWKSKSGELIKESVIIIEARCDEISLSANLENVIDLARAIQSKMKQESIALEINNVMYFIQ